MRAGPKSNKAGEVAVVRGGESCGSSRKREQPRILRLSVCVWRAVKKGAGSRQRHSGLERPWGKTLVGRRDPECDLAGEGCGVACVLLAKLGCLYTAAIVKGD
ncbi:hypothetical protein NDU88_005070 [Pleurodeles waltl]|uniref:Uncharacterized protein n=1 Tax=Pleurodeles waltl TaxID=8319 RepID=A0AAV7TAX4_PLEWA|nr:hypothetical protein NDU88_005070 [Pleurodeles waltl]